MPATGHVSARVASGPPKSAVVYRASGALSGSGAYDAVTWFELPPYIEKLSLAVSYTLGANSTITGYATIRPMFKSTDVANHVFREVDFDFPVVSGATIKKPVRELEIPLPTPSGGAGSTAEDVVVFRIPPGMTHFACPAAEAGDTANPGTLACWVLTGV